MAQAGDEVVILPGTYLESYLTPKFSGEPGAPIIIRGEGFNGGAVPGVCASATPSDVVLRGPSVFSRGFLFHLYDGAHVPFDPDTFEGFGYYVFRNFDMTNYTAPFDFRMGTPANNYSEAPHDILIEDVNLYRNKRGILGSKGFHDLLARRVQCCENNIAFLEPEGTGLNGHDFDNGINEPLGQGGPYNLTFIDCDSFDHDDGAGPGGDADSWVFQAECNNVTLIRCRAWGNSEDGFDFKCNNVTLDQCQAWDCGGSTCKAGGAETVDGQASYDETHNYTIRNCIFIGNGGTALSLKPNSSGTVLNSTLVVLSTASANAAPARTFGYGNDSFEPRMWTFKNCILFCEKDTGLALQSFDPNLSIRSNNNIFLRVWYPTSTAIGLNGIGPFTPSDIADGTWTAALLANGAPAGLAGENDIGGFESPQ